MYTSLSQALERLAEALHDVSAHLIEVERVWRIGSRLVAAIADASTLTIRTRLLGIHQAPTTTSVLRPSLGLDEADSLTAFAAHYQGHFAGRNNVNQIANMIR